MCDYIIANPLLKLRRSCEYGTVHSWLLEPSVFILSTHSPYSAIPNKLNMVDNLKQALYDGGVTEEALEVRELECNRARSYRLLSY